MLSKLRQTVHVAHFVLDSSQEVAVQGMTSKFQMFTCACHGFRSKSLRQQGDGQTCLAAWPGETRTLDISGYNEHLDKDILHPWVN